MTRRNEAVYIEPVTKVPPTPREGDIVVGRVTDIKGSVALVELSRIKGSLDREIAGNTSAAIHISNVKDSYVQDLAAGVRLPGHRQGEIIDTKNMRLSTVDKNLGVHDVPLLEVQDPTQVRERQAHVPAVRAPGEPEDLRRTTAKASSVR